MVLPNIAWTMETSASELDSKQLELENSREAVAWISFFSLSLCSSVNHLSVLTAQRLVAIKWPLLYKTSSTKPTIIGMLLAWFVAAIAAITPGK